MLWYQWAALGVNLTAAFLAIMAALWAIVALLALRRTSRKQRALFTQAMDNLAFAKRAYEQAVHRIISEYSARARQVGATVTVREWTPKE